MTIQPMTIDRIKLMIFDVDGVLTDGTLYYGATGETMKAFSTLDGLGLKLLKQSGVDVAVITGRHSEALHQRLDDLGIYHRYTAVNDKAEAFRKLMKVTGLTADQTGYMGDDIVDLPVMRCCGLSITVPEADKIMQDHAHWVTKRRGGQGAVREACEKIMQQQGTWEALLANFLMPATDDKA